MFCKHAVHFLHTCFHVDYANRCCCFSGLKEIARNLSMPCQQLGFHEWLYIYNQFQPYALPAAYLTAAATPLHMFCWSFSSCFWRLRPRLATAKSNIQSILHQTYHFSIQWYSEDSRPWKPTKKIMFFMVLEITGDLDDFDCQQVDDLHQLGLGLK